MTRYLIPWTGSLFLHLLAIGGILAAGHNLQRPRRIDLVDFRVVTVPPEKKTQPPAAPRNPMPRQEKPQSKPEPVPRPAQRPVARAAPPPLPEKPSPDPLPATSPVEEEAPPVAPLVEAPAKQPGAPAILPAPPPGADRQVPATAEEIAKRQTEQYLGAHFSYIRERVIGALRYPLMARRQGWSGQVKIEFTILSSGKIRDLKVVESSGHPLLDRQALRAVEEAEPFPPPPAVATITLPVSFQLN